MLIPDVPWNNTLFEYDDCLDQTRNSTCTLKVTNVRLECTYH